MGKEVYRSNDKTTPTNKKQFQLTNWLRYDNSTNNVSISRSPITPTPNPRVIPLADRSAEWREANQYNGPNHFDY